MKTLAVVLAFLLTVSALLNADPLIRRAQQREKAGDMEGAAHLYGGWLRINAGAPGSALVFSRYFQLENDYLALRDASLRFLATGGGLPGAAAQFGAIARLLETGGMPGEARDAYLRASAEGAADSALVSAFFLSLRMHDTDAMAKCLAGLQAREGAEKHLLEVLADIEAGHAESAGAALAGLSRTSGNADVELKALWLLYARAKAAEDQKEQANARARLSADFPGAPETALAASPRSAAVVLYPSPDIFVAADSADQSEPPPAAPALPAVSRTGEPDQPLATPQTSESAQPSVRGTSEQVQPPVPPQSAEPVRVSVQAGSFQVKENADDLFRDLSRRGFFPVQRVETIQGKEYYRVFAGVGLDATAARALLAKLLQQGFTGIVVNEK